MAQDLEGLPGAELVVAGLDDLHAGRVTENSLLMLIARGRLRRLGLDVPANLDTSRPASHQLYELLEDSIGPSAYSRYNSLLRRLTSFLNAMDHRASANAGATRNPGSS